MREKKPPLQSGHILLFWFHYGFPQVVAIPKIRFFTVCILKRTPFLNGPIDMTNFDFQIRQSMSFLRKQSPFVDLLKDLPLIDGLFGRPLSTPPSESFETSSNHLFKIRSPNYDNHPMYIGYRIFPALPLPDL